MILVRGDRPGRICRRIRGRLALRFYGALGPGEAARVERHLQACAACAVEWRRTRRALGAVDPGAAFPRESEVDWRAQARLTVARARASAEAAEGAAWAPWRRASSAPALRLALAAAAAVAILAALVLPVLRPRTGPRGSAPGEPIPGTGAPLEAARLIQGLRARQGAERCLADGREVLVNLARPRMSCRRAGPAYDIRLEKQRSVELLRHKNLYERSLTGTGDARLAALLDQLEAVLLEVSSLDDCASAAQLHDLRQEIERRRILLRIDLVTRERRGRTERA